MSLAAADERAHAPSEASWWWETWQLDVASEAGVGLAVRLSCAPALGAAWWWTHLLMPDLGGPVVVRDHEVPLPRQGLEVRADGLWGELWCETPFEHWTYGLEAFGVRLDDPADSLRGEVGERMPIGLDIEWEVEPDRPEPHELGPGAAERGYEQFGSAHGDVLLGRSRFEIDAPARRSHTWGAPRFDRPATSSWIRSPELSASFTSDESYVDGFVARDGVEGPISAVRGETHRRDDGLPVGARYFVNDGIEIEADVVGLVSAPLLGPGNDRAVLSRGLCRYRIAEADRADSDRWSGVGWSSWLDPA